MNAPPPSAAARRDVWLRAPWSGAPLPTVRIVTLAVCLFGLVHVLATAYISSWTYDEPHHIEYSKRMLLERKTERKSKGYFRSTTPVSLLNATGDILAHAYHIGKYGFTGPGRRFMARVPTAFFYLLMLWGVWRIGLRVTDEVGAALATSATALDLSLVAHSSLATVDAAYAAATVWALLAMAYALEKRSLRGAVALGVGIGFAFSAKFTAVLLVACLLFAPFLLWNGSTRRAKRVAAQQNGKDNKLGRWALGVMATVAGAALVSILFIDATYLFVRPTIGFGTTAFSSDIFKSVAERAPWLWLPLPEDFVMGIDSVLAEERGREWNVYLFGQHYPSGVWYYFVAVWLVKTPLPVILAVLTGLGYSIASGKILRNPMARLLLFSLALFAFYFSFIFRTQVGIRYVLMCLPLTYLLCAPAWSAMWRWPGGRLLLGLAGLAAFAGHLVYYGNPLSYTNALVWPKRDAYKFIADSNIQWAQNANKLKRLRRRLGAPKSALDPPSLREGWNIIDLNKLTGVSASPEYYRWIRENLEPDGHFRHTYLLYNLDHETWLRYLRDERTLQPNTNVVNTCRRRGEWEVRDKIHKSGERKRFHWICLEVDEPTALTFTSIKGQNRFGPHEGACRYMYVDDNDVLTYLLEPGMHAFCFRGAETYEMSVDLDRPVNSLVR